MKIPQASGPLFAHVMALGPAPRIYTYSVPEEFRQKIAPGARVLAPFGRRSVIGVVAGLADFSEVETKPISAVLDDAPALSPQLLELIGWTADYYFAPPGEVAALALPKAESKIETMVELAGTPPEEGGKSKGSETLAVLAAHGGSRKLHLLAKDMGVKAGELKRILSGPKVKPHVRLLYTGALKTPLAASSAHKEAAALERVELTEGQRAAVETAAPDILAGRFGVCLLHGVTGSGKTEVYAALAEIALRQGKSALVLAPEIALAEMMAKRLSRRLGVEAILLHSGLTPKTRMERWISARGAEACLVVGARSAVFAPARRLGLIIVDEEHDLSYKQGETPRYNGRDVAIKRGQLENAPVLLGTATPSMESYRNAVSGKYKLINLSARVDGKPMPVVELITPEKGELGLGEELTARIEKCLAAGDQALLFLNRRGSARVVECMQCGYVFECKNCALRLIQHSDQRRLRCHSCGYEEPSPDRCPQCQGAALREGGAGTKKIERDLRELFPDSRIERLDRDAASKKNASKRILDGMEEGIVDVLVGTQMVAKGHDYHGITLVGVVSADDSLNAPDFRAAERTFQQITQAAGRGGRGDKPGTVVVLSRNPEHHSVQTAARHDYAGFYAKEAPLREALNYPPFVRLAMIRVEAATARRGEEFLAGAEPILRKMERDWPGLTRLGPVDAVVFRVKNRFRWKILFKAKGPALLAKALRRFIAETAQAAGGKGGRVRLIVDMDALDVM